jgi:hypothetical protein
LKRLWRGFSTPLYTVMTVRGTRSFRAMGYLCQLERDTIRFSCSQGVLLQVAVTPIVRRFNCQECVEKSAV